ncbi:MAG: ABC transporter ATP-binding protein [Lautropia sp.]|nr:ABC transporter ATP-binding protein [Lautropia sp.]MCL4701057.1 ABC transporter ATP-binding protein [Burkholderiaceae bacterium]MDL1907924.1 ABC transporter ATP-binding protein [Betaproteobacteria bacterium PRO1]RIK90444.1 MAG: ABC transporter ATP-binding protein [Burkholderiales bacterium]
MSLPASPAPAVELIGVRKTFAGRAVLDGVDLNVRRGERVALLGESGSGKSTLLHLIAGLEPVDAGMVRVAGTEVSALDADAAASFRRSAIGFVFQAFHLLPHLDAARNVAVPLLLNGVAAPAALERATAMLARVGLAGRASAWPRELSGGEQQRVALARALVHAPALVLADEPTGNLDPSTAAQALALIAGALESSGAALVLVTHSAQAAAIAHRRLRLDARGLRPDDATLP